jgi:hypothetical protein
MAAIRGIVRAICASSVVDPTMKAAVSVIYDSAGLAAHLGLGEVIEGSCSTEETRARLEAAAAKLGVEVVIKDEGRRAHAPLSRAAAKSGTSRVGNRLRAADLHLGDDAPDESLGVLAWVAYRILNTEARNYSKAPPPEQQRIANRVCQNLVRLLNRDPDKRLVVRLLTNLGRAGTRGSPVWEPLAELIRPPGSNLTGPTVRKSVQRRKA